MQKAKEFGKGQIFFLATVTSYISMQADFPGLVTTEGEKCEQ